MVPPSTVFCFPLKARNKSSPFISLTKDQSCNLVLTFPVHMTSGKEKSYSVHTTELRKNFKFRTILFHANYAINTSGFDVLWWQVIYFFFVIFLPMINADINVLMNLPTCLSTSPPEDDIPHAHIYVLPLAVYWRFISSEC